MKENPDDPRTVLNNDCLAPEGYGEIIGGSQREDDYDKLLARIQRQGLDPEAYRWYLDLRKYGTFVHSGFGLGLERTVAWICGHPAHPGGDRVSAADSSVVSLTVGRSDGRTSAAERRHGDDLVAASRDPRSARIRLVSLTSDRPTVRPSASPRPTARPAPPARAVHLDPARSAKRSTSSNRSRNFRLARSSAGPGCTPAFRARLTTANSRSPISPPARRSARAWACSGRPARPGDDALAGAGAPPPPPPAPRAPSRSAPRRRASRTRPTPRAPAAGTP